MALVGDVMLSRQLTPYQEPAYLQLVELLRSADVGFANLETVVREPQEGHPNFTLGTPMTTPPKLLEDLHWFGIQLVSIANNHATDYSITGMEAMLAHLKASALTAAGAGMHLAAARAPAYIDTAAGRVGLVAATSFFRPWNSAADQRPDMQGRPGINPLGFATTYEVDGPTFTALQQMYEKLGLAQERLRHSRQFYSAKELGDQNQDRLTLFGQTFIRSNAFAIKTRTIAQDADANLKALKEARRQCDWLIFSFHSHEFGDAGRLTAESDTQLQEPAQFMRDFSRAAIDAGADVVVGHGHHVTLGADMYRGRPIFYSLGNFVFQNDSVTQFPAEAYRRFGLGHEASPADFLDARTSQDTRGFPTEPEFWEGAVATVSFEAGQTAQVQLHPVDLGFGSRRSERGRPMLATGEKAQRILERLERMTARNGLKVTRSAQHLTIHAS